MADQLVEAAVSMLPLVEDLMKLAWYSERDLEVLRNSLSMTGAFLRDAQRKQLDEPLKDWLKQLRRVVCEAEDVFDELAYEDLRRKVETQTITKVINFFSPCKNPLAFTLAMAFKVNLFQQSIKTINQQARDLGLQDRFSNLVNRGVPDTGAYVVSSEFVGRKGDVRKLIGLLTGSNTEQNLRIVSIVGMAGLGKTTLAKSVCKNEKVKNHFKDKIIEVCVSENFNVSRILQEMYESLVREKCDLRNEGAILQKIQEKLKGITNYLLMLDDVWDEGFGNWNSLRARLQEIFEGNQSRCTILVTSRSEDVAVVKQTPPENRHPLDKLKGDECWAIIKKRAFENSSISPPVYSRLEKIGRDIADKCGGVPLLASIVGGTMCNNLEIDEWESIRDDSLWAFLENNDKGIVRVLRLSFDRLYSSALKMCFVYCSIFPKDYVIEKQKLIPLWMAEGFLQQSVGCSQLTLEDIGNKYFNSLLSNSLLQDVEMDLYGCITACKMHDLVHDLAKSIRNSEIGSIFHVQEQDILNGLKSGHCLFFKSCFIHLIEGFKGLRSLNLRNANVDCLPDSIGGLKHLRFIDISETRISSLPKSITQLYLLQTLRLLWCHSLTELPEGMKSLASLRHLCFTNESLVLHGIKNLTSLRTLSIFNVNTERGFEIRELGDLRELGGELKLLNLQKVRNREEAWEANLRDKKGLHELIFRWEYGRSEDCSSNDEEVLERLEPHSNLKSLAIMHYIGGNFPTWMARKTGVSDAGACVLLNNLVELKLLQCRNVKNLPTLGLYPNLKVLEICGLKNVRSIGKEFYVDDSWFDGRDDKNNMVTLLFPTLEVFELGEMEELEEWLIQMKPTIPVFPSLKHLTISSCEKLSIVPTMTRFTSLEILIIGGCTELSLTREEELEGDAVFSSTLKMLKIYECKKLRFIPGVEGGISSLEELIVTKCKNLSKIGATLFASTCLRDAYIRKCPNLIGIPLSGESHSLKSLEIKDCKNLREIDGGLSKITGLETICVSGCPNLISIPSLNSSFLSEIKVWDCGLTSLPEFQSCTSLQTLRIGDFKNMEKSFPGESIGHFPYLKEIRLGHFSEKLEEFPFFSCTHNSLPSLKCLRLFGWEKLSSLPHQLQHLTALDELCIDGFGCMKALPEWLGNLSSLQRLEIAHCENLQQAPSNEAMQRLSNLNHILVVNCPRFWENCDEFWASKMIYII